MWAHSQNTFKRNSQIQDHQVVNIISPKCHFVTYYSHFRVLGNLANISVLNRGKTAKENGNFDYWSLYSKLEKLESQDVLTNAYNTVFHDQQ